MRLMDIVNSIVTLPSLGIGRNAPIVNPVVEKVEEKEEEIVVSEANIKYHKTITKAEFAKKQKDSKTIINGIHYLMFYDDKIGTFLAPVKIEG
jgi:hypothetical protein